jgi:glycosyltransferase involved in cell wall biosynthesis
VWLTREGAARDKKLIAGRPWKFLPILDIQGTTVGNRVRNLVVRARRRIESELYSRWGGRFPAALGYGAQDLMRTALIIAADLTIVHSQAGLWVGAKLLERGRRVGVDFEDWFSEDVRPEERHIEGMGWLRELEQQLARECTYSLTTSRAMASAMATEYRSPEPAVVYNVFPSSERAMLDGSCRDRKDLSLPSVHWFSQTIGRDRGLELLFRAVGDVSIPFEIHLRGNVAPGYRDYLERIVPSGWQERLFIHDTVPNDELLSRIAEHDVGLALETPDIRSRNLTVTNKLFQYVQAGLAVIATDTAGQSEVFAQAPDMGLLIKHNDAAALSRALTQLLGDRNHLKRARQASLEASRRHFCWDVQKNTVIDSACRALAG